MKDGKEEQTKGRKYLYYDFMIRHILSVILMPYFPQQHVS